VIEYKLTIVSDVQLKWML